MDGLKDELEEIPNVSDLAPYNLQHQKIGPRIIDTYMQLISEKSSTDGYITFLMGFTRSPIRDFESYPRVSVGLDGDDFQFKLKQNISNFVTYDIVPGV